MDLATSTWAILAPIVGRYWGGAEFSGGVPLFHGIPGQSRAEEWNGQDDALPIACVAGVRNPLVSSAAGQAPSRSPTLVQTTWGATQGVVSLRQTKVPRKRNFGVSGVPFRVVREGAIGPESRALLWALCGVFGATRLRGGSALVKRTHRRWAVHEEMVHQIHGIRAIRHPIIIHVGGGHAAKR